MKRKFRILPEEETEVEVDQPETEESGIEPYITIKEEEDQELEGGGEEDVEEEEAEVSCNWIKIILV